MQMRKYYCDVYTGQSIVCFESHSLDSILTVASQFIVPAQVISLYSYKTNPYNFKHETIFAQTLEEDSNCSSSSSSFAALDQSNFKSFYHYRESRQYHTSQSRER